MFNQPISSHCSHYCIQFELRSGASSHVFGGPKLAGISCFEKMNESQAEEALPEWVAREKITAKTVDLLVKEGFNYMEALVVVDRADLQKKFRGANRSFC